MTAWMCCELWVADLHLRTLHWLVWSFSAPFFFFPKGNSLSNRIGSHGLVDKSLIILEW
jgi:hypothetical protein